MDNNTVEKNVTALAEKMILDSTTAQSRDEVRQWKALPLLQALGYDPYSRDIRPVNLMLDNNGTVPDAEKSMTGYIVSDSGQERMLVCCLVAQEMFDKAERIAYKAIEYCSEHHNNINIVVMTDGTKYQFYVCRLSTVVAQVKPYEVLLLCDQSMYIKAFCRYSRNNIKDFDPKSIVIDARVENACSSLISELLLGNVPAYMVSIVSEMLVNEWGTDIYASDEVLDSINNNLSEKFRGLRQTKVAKMRTKADSPDKAEDSSGKKTKQKSDIKLRHDYVFNDYSEGDWTYHEIDHATIFGVSRIEVDNGRKLLIAVIKELLMRGHLKAIDLLNSDKFKGVYRVATTDEGMRDPFFIEGYGVYVSTAYSLHSIVKFIEKLLDLAKLEYSTVKISFKS